MILVALILSAVFLCVISAQAIIYVSETHGDKMGFLAAIVSIGSVSFITIMALKGVGL